MVRLAQTWALASRAPVVRGAKMLTYVQLLVASPELPSSVHASVLPLFYPVSSRT